MHPSSYHSVKAKMLKKSHMTHRPDMKKSEATGYLDAEDRAEGAEPGSTVRPVRQNPTRTNVQRLPGKLGEMGMR